MSRFYLLRLGMKALSFKNMLMANFAFINNPLTKLGVLANLKKINRIFFKSIQTMNSIQHFLNCFRIEYFDWVSIYIFEFRLYFTRMTTAVQRTNKRHVQYLITDVLLSIF